MKWNTKTTRKNVRKRIKEMTKEFETFKLDTGGYGTTITKMTEKEFDDLVNEIFSNLGADLKNYLEVSDWCGYMNIRTYGSVYIYVMIVEEQNTSKKEIKAGDVVKINEKEYKVTAVENYGFFVKGKNNIITFNDSFEIVNR